MILTRKKNKSKKIITNNKEYFNQFRVLFSLSVITLLGFMSLFFVLCGYDLGHTGENSVDDYILGHFGSTGAAILIIGFPFLMIFFTYVYLMAYKMK